MNPKEEALRHTAEHVLHTAMQKLYPTLKKVMGPPIETGFYFDFDLEDQNITPDDFPTIEAEMQKIIDAKLPIVRKEISLEEAKKLFKDNPYKLDTIERLESKNESESLPAEAPTPAVVLTENEPSKPPVGNNLNSHKPPILTIYEIGSPNDKYHDIDLCKGPHLENTGQIKAFKLMEVAGAYYLGDEKNKMLQRIYGVAFDTSEELEKYIHLVEEAKKRDHRKLGQQLDLFCFSELVGPGLPLFTPKGTIIKEELQKHVEKVCREYGFEKVITPHLAKVDLYEISGHAKKFSDELFHVKSVKGHEFVMKPVQCPHQTQIFASKLRSYKDLPIRYMESEKQYRAEKPGEVGGLNRVYAITVEDG
nr:threonine--tRNA ligase [Patescibacteria group bacterium]